MKNRLNSQPPALLVPRSLLKGRCRLSSTSTLTLEPSLPESHGKECLMPTHSTLSSWIPPNPWSKPLLCPSPPRGTPQTPTRGPRSLPNSTCQRPLQPEPVKAMSRPSTSLRPPAWEVPRRNPLVCLRPARGTPPRSWITIASGPLPRSHRRPPRTGMPLCQRAPTISRSLPAAAVALSHAHQPAVQTAGGLFR